MSGTVISVENLSKAYQLGQIGTGTLTNDLRLWWNSAARPTQPAAPNRRERPRQPRR
ncbi:MAG: hypothetical protein M5U05_03800 [Anaerolineales bacterium]|nr:hypothetical protein [Anaerolineales bacterium]